MKWTLIIFGLVAAAVLATVLTGSRSSNHGAVSVVGSTSIQPFAEMLSQEFNRKQKKYYVEVQGGGSTAGIEAVRNQIAAIGMCSRGLKDDEKFDAVTIARDGLAVVVNEKNPVVNLSKAQIREIFAGRVKNWKQVGGPDLVINTISREEGSGTREAFMKLVMGHGERVSRSALTQESNGAVRELVRNDPGAIGYMSLGLVLGQVKILKVDGVFPTHETVTNKTYSLVRPFLFVRGKSSEGAEEFIKYVLSNEGQKMLEEEGLVRVK